MALNRLSAAALFKVLPLNAKVNWQKRLTADVIVLVDWFGEKVPGSAIHALENIMTKVKPNYHKLFFTIF